ncbi:class I SAM-dependent methyltransferase [Aliarcobacter cryaerophilus]|uniref:TylF/MycF/NovP-related O-methyltransferase n=1 Tax=Aliarcobacter cryaerophilus TaxID=28198 RepID=UPI003BAEB80A
MKKEFDNLNKNKVLNSEALLFSKNFNIFFNYLHILKETEEKYLIYGYGVIGKTIKNILGKQIVGFLDKNELLWNDKENIFSPNKVQELKFDKIIISVLGRDEEITTLLKNNYKIQNDKILIFPIGTNQYQDNLYQKINVNATYNPWFGDLEFLDIYNQIKDNTLVDIFRCYELFTLVKQSSKLKSGALIEIGVFEGGTGAIIAKQAELSNINEKVYLCDTFNGVVKSSEYDPNYYDGEHKATKNTVENLLQDINIQNTVILEGIFPDETGREIENLQFRFCHIDVDVYYSANDIVEWIWPKMVVGGMIVYDDYGYSTCKGITKHVNELSNDDDKMIFYNTNGHAIIIKIKD